MSTNTNTGQHKTIKCAKTTISPDNQQNRRPRILSINFRIHNVIEPAQKPFAPRDSLNV